jgi:hypothetical protein
VVLIEATQLLALDLPLNLLGQRLHAKALGPLETLEAVDTHVYAPTAAALRPLAPAHVQLERKQDGALHFSWIRCSRLGFDWLDHADVPLSEEAERYQLRLEVPGHAPRLWEVGHAHFVYTPEAQQAEAGGLIMAGRLAVAQISAAVGAGPEAALDFNAS